MKNFNINLFIALLAFFLIPSIYETLRTFLISENTVDGFSIIGHLEWFDLLYEFISTFCIIPLYFIFKNSLAIQTYKKDTFMFEQYLKSILLVFTGVFIIFSFITLLSLDLIISSMNVSDNIPLVKSFLKLELIHFFLDFIYSIFFISLVTLGKTPYLYILLLTKTFLIFLADSIFLKTFGIIGIAYSNISVSLLLCVISCILVVFASNRNFFKAPFEFSWIQSWLKVGSFTGLENLLANIIYSFMIVRYINTLAFQGEYWLANQFI